jgi:ABC-type spermidine/putrescine transport system permease subunit I
MRHIPALFIACVFGWPIVIWGLWVLTASQESSFPFSLLWPALVRTHKLALAVASLSVILAMPPSLLCEYAGEELRAIVSTLVLAPLLLGMLSRNYAWVGLFSESNTIGSLDWMHFAPGRLIHTESAVLIVMTAVFVPSSFFLMRLALSAVAVVHVDAARSLGADDSALLRTVFLRPILKGAALGFLFAYCSALGFFITPRFLGPNKGDLVGSIVVRFTELGELQTASHVAAVFLITAAPAAGLFLYLVQRIKG